MPREGLDSLEISQGLGHLIDPQHASMAGVCARDELPAVFKEIHKRYLFPLCMVVNTDDAEGAGIHWVALYFFSATQCEFFDSYGQTAKSYNIKIPVRAIASANSQQLQSNSSTVCGLYCLYYLAYRCRGVKNMFACFSPTSTNTNDRKIKSLVGKLMKRTSRQLPHPCFSCISQRAKPRSFIVQ